MKNLKNSIWVVILFALGAAATSFMGNESSKTTVSIDSVIKEETVSVKPVAKPKIELPPILVSADSICKEAGVPFELIKEIGDNESNWRYVGNSTGGTDFGDLQVIEPTFWHMHDKLNLEGGKTRINYLAAGIYYLKDQYDRYGSWRKARFAYGRGHWRGPETWTALEQKFMGKIDWTKYDK
jgi:hypothetical protein